MESPSVDPLERKGHDAATIKEMLTSIGVALEDDEVASLRRLGPRAESPPTQETGAAPVTKPRPILLSFKSSQTRATVLSSAKKLANSEMKHVSICPDLTKNQQKDDRELREEVKRLNLEEPSDDKGPFLWKVVGTPGQPNRRKIKKYYQDPNH